MDCIASSTKTTDDATVFRSAFIYALKHACSKKKEASREFCALVGVGLQFCWEKMQMCQGECQRLDAPYEHSFAFGIFICTGHLLLAHYFRTVALFRHVHPPITVQELRSSYCETRPPFKLVNECLQVSFLGKESSTKTWAKLRQILYLILSCKNWQLCLKEIIVK